MEYEFLNEFSLKEKSEDNYSESLLDFEKLTEGTNDEIRRLLGDIVTLLSGKPYYECFSKKKIKKFRELSKKHPNMKEVNDYFEEIFSLLYYKQNRHVSFPPILLLGNPGCGKTEWACSMSEILIGRSSRLDFGNELTSFQLAGSQRGYSKPETGMIIKSMFSRGKGPVMNPIFILDELEKIKPDKHSPEHTLLCLLEKSSSKKFMDNFLEQTVDCSAFSYIACCNSLEGIPAPLLDRFKVFNIPDYTRQDLVDFVIPEIYKKWILEENFDLTKVPAELDKETCERCAEISENKTRNIKHALRTILIQELKNKKSESDSDVI